MAIKGRGELSRPLGIAIDSNNMVFVSEIGNHRVSIFTSEGHHLAAMVKNQDDSHILMHCVVYVCDGGNGRVQVF